MISARRVILGKLRPVAGAGFFEMQTRNDFDANAAKCAKLAQSARTDADRARWLKMERYWREKPADAANDDPAPAKYIIDR